MGKCASKDVVKGQVVPETELDNAGSPMFAPEAPVVGEAAEYAGGVATSQGAPISFQGYAPAPVEPVAAAVATYPSAVTSMPLPRGQDVDVVDATAEYPTGYGGSQPLYGGPQPTYGAPAYPAAAGNTQYFASLEEAEAAARKQNESWGVPHVAYKAEAYPNFQAGTTYAAAFPPAASVDGQQRASAYEPTPVEPVRAAEQYPMPAYQTEPAQQVYPSAAYPTSYASPPQQAPLEEPTAEPVPVAEPQQGGSPLGSPEFGGISEPVAVVEETTQAAPAEAAQEAPAKKEKKKKKKKSNWAW